MPSPKYVKRGYYLKAYVEERQVELLKRLARKNDRSLSAEVRAALRFYLQGLGYLSKEAL